jgi:hypothetical protein
MSKPISLFSGYVQRENRVTNYCLLILKMIYEENPKYLDEALVSLIGEQLSIQVGVTFRQQERRQRSIPDGLIVQQAFTIYIETKNEAWFDDQQLENHLSALNAEGPARKVLLALGNFEGDQLTRFNRIQEICRTTYQGTISFRGATFDDFLSSLEIAGLSKTLTDAITDFRSFLNEQSLLPSWRSFLDVINCAGYPDEVTVGGVYMCPAQSGSYEHSRARYFGMYRNKQVERVAEIEAVIDVDLAAVDPTSLKWNNLGTNINTFTHRAIAKVQEWRPNEGPTRIFLLGPLFPTSFLKDSRGGMRGSKQYFDIANLDVTDASQLATALHNRRWSEFPRRDE